MFKVLRSYIIIQVLLFLFSSLGLNAHAEESRSIDESPWIELCEDWLRLAKQKIENWIIQSQSSQELQLPAGLSFSEYQKNMLTAIRSSVLRCRIEPQKLGDIEKSCWNNGQREGGQIRCNMGKIFRLPSPQRYELLHHEYAGLAGFEISQGVTSNYFISRQIPQFFVDIMGSNGSTDWIPMPRHPVHGKLYWTPSFQDKSSFQTAAQQICLLEGYSELVDLQPANITFDHFLKSEDLYLFSRLEHAETTPLIDPMFGDLLFQLMTGEHQGQPVLNTKINLDIPTNVFGLEWGKDFFGKNGGQILGMEQIENEGNAKIDFQIMERGRPGAVDAGNFLSAIRCRSKIGEERRLRISRKPLAPSRSQSDIDPDQPTSFQMAANGTIGNGGDPCESLLNEQLIRLRKKLKGSDRRLRTLEGLQFSCWSNVDMIFPEKNTCFNLSLNGAPTMKQCLHDPETVYDFTNPCIRNQGSNQILCHQRFVSPSHIDSLFGDLEQELNKASK